MCPMGGRSGAPEGLAGASSGCLCLSHRWDVLARACVCACPGCACFCLQAHQVARLPHPRNMSPPGCACVTSLSPQGQSVYLLRASPLPSLAETRGPPKGVGVSPSPGRPRTLWFPFPSNQAAGPGPLVHLQREGDQEFGCRGQLCWGQRAGPPAWAVDMVMCPGDVGLRGWPDPTAVYSVNFNLYITFSIPIVTKLIFTK